MVFFIIFVVAFATSSETHGLPVSQLSYSYSVSIIIILSIALGAC